LRPQGPVPLAKPVRPMCRVRPPRSSLPNGRWAESFADDLNTRRGIVSGRVALLPRSTEIQPHVAQIRPSPQVTILPRRSNLMFRSPNATANVPRRIDKSTKSWGNHTRVMRKPLRCMTLKYGEVTRNIYLHSCRNYKVFGKHARHQIARLCAEGTYGVKVFVQANDLSYLLIPQIF
jgi:hypothetical protein